MKSLASFIKMLERYLSGTASPKDEGEIDRWYDGLSVDKDKIEISQEEESKLKAEYWAKVTEKASIPNFKNFRIWPVAASIAAAITLTIVVLLSTYVDVSQQGQNLRELNQSTEIVNHTNLAKVVTLVDSSTVSLSPGSQLIIDANFNKTDRQVTLKGEAFFHVARNTGKAFFVNTDKITTKVLGTSFNVKAIDEQNISVSVNSGSVCVYQSVDAGRDEKYLVLKPNEQAVFDRKLSTVSKTLVENPRMIIESDKIPAMKFTDRPVWELFDALENMYGVTIKYDSTLFSTCRVTTSLSKDSVFNKIESICHAIGATYKVENALVVIEGPGCNQN